MMLLNLCLCGPEDYYGIQYCPEIDNSKYVDSISITLEKIPTQGVEIYGTLYIIPNRNYFVSYTYTELKSSQKELGYILVIHRLIDSSKTVKLTKIRSN